MIVESPEKAHLLSIIGDGLDVDPQRAKARSRGINSPFVHVIIERHAFWHSGLWDKFRAKNPGSRSTSMWLVVFATQVDKIA